MRLGKHPATKGTLTPLALAPSAVEGEAVGFKALPS